MAGYGVSWGRIRGSARRKGREPMCTQDNVPNKEIIKRCCLYPDLVQALGKSLAFIERSYDYTGISKFRDFFKDNWSKEVELLQQTKRTENKPAQSQYIAGSDAEVMNWMIEDIPCDRGNVE